jgi:hypothetical protein
LIMIGVGFWQGYGGAIYEGNIDLANYGCSISSILGILLGLFVAIKTVQPRITIKPTTGQPKYGTVENADSAVADAWKPIDVNQENSNTVPPPIN